MLSQEYGAGAVANTAVVLPAQVEKVAGSRRWLRVRQDETGVDSRVAISKAVVQILGANGEHVIGGVLKVEQEDAAGCRRLYAGSRRDRVERVDRGSENVLRESPFDSTLVVGGVPKARVDGLTLRLNPTRSMSCAKRSATSP